MKRQTLFAALAQIFHKQVKKYDKSRCADRLKQCTEALFESVNHNYELEDQPVTITDIEYRDGYFIFGMGTNSVVHFRIEECPGWLFAVWWDVPDKKDPKDRITGTFFCQFEATIDKFKPSRSEITAKVTVAFPEGANQYCECWEVSKAIRFIRDEPYLAFCRDYNGWDYNEEYHTREEAEAKYHKWKTYHDSETAWTSQMNERVLSFVREKVIPHLVFRNATIKDRGECWSPRFEVVAPFEDNKDIVDEPGYYRWFADDDQDGQKICEEFHQLIQECSAIGDEKEFFWFAPLDDSIACYLSLNKDDNSTD